MSVILITGQPGGGKTALCVDMIAHDPQFIGRPLFIMGIPDLTIEHNVCPPVSEWTEYRESPEDNTIKLPYFTFPQGSLVVLDEAQRVYRPRPVGSKVPPEVAAFETHRHCGIDFILLTQHAGLLDSNIRKLIGRHIHIRVTALGRTKYEWTELGDPDQAASRAVAISERYTLPKRAFALYKSSQLHTKIKVKMPFYVYMFAVAFVALIVLGYFSYQRVFHKTNPLDPTAVPGQKPSGTAGGAPAPLTAADLMKSYDPRIPGLAHTAPRYDEITKVIDAPWPAACIITAAKKNEPQKCRCIDQQGSKYTTSEAVCTQFVQNGMFKDWTGPEKQSQDDKKNQYARPESSPVAQQTSRSGSMPVNPPGLYPGMMGESAAVPQQAQEMPQGQPMPRVPDNSPWRHKG